jgi:peptidoglycan/xylan/chitin deacetylase (PgdA/CDA1 family)
MLTGLGVALYFLGLARLVVWFNRRSPKVLIYHACEATESDLTRGLRINTTPAQFTRHLAYLIGQYHVVSLDDLVTGHPCDRAVAITFDDGFRSVYTHAWPLWRDLSLPVTCYLTTSVIGNDALIWINELNWFLRRHPATARMRALERLGIKCEMNASALIEKLVDHYDPDVIGGLLTDLRSATGVEPSSLARDERPYLDWKQIHEMAAAGVTFGNHTATHPPLARISLQACREEIGQAAAALERLPGAGTTLAYPFGSHDESIRTLALELGNRSLLKVDGVNSQFDATRIGRIKVGAHSAAVLFARMEVVEPFKAALKRLRSALPSRSSNRAELQGPDLRRSFRERRR